MHIADLNLCNSKQTQIFTSLLNFPNDKTDKNKIQLYITVVLTF